jgi:hypothetical protein
MNNSRYKKYETMAALAGWPSCGWCGRRYEPPAAVSGPPITYQYPTPKLKRCGVNFCLYVSDRRWLETIEGRSCQPTIARRQKPAAHESALKRAIARGVKSASTELFYYRKTKKRLGIK